MSESSKNLVRYIDVLLYSHQSDVLVKEELAQLSDIFKLIEDINQQMMELNNNYTEEPWFKDLMRNCAHLITKSIYN